MASTSNSLRRIEASWYQCLSCDFIYKPEEGDAEGGIAPGTRFSDIPDDWVCPVCGARKTDFVPYESE